MVTELKECLMQVGREFSEDECPSMAAALACSVLFAMPSPLLIVIFIAGVFLGPKAASGEIQARLRDSIGSQTAGQIQSRVSGVASNRMGGIIARQLRSDHEVG